MNIILPVFYKLAVHQISFGVIVIDEHQINGSRGVFPISIVVSIFLHVELALTAFGKPPTLAGFQLISYFLNTFHVLGRRFRILVRSTDFLYFIPVCMQVTFHKTDSHFGRIFMQFIICLIFRNYRIFTAWIEQQRKSCSYQEHQCDFTYICFHFLFIWLIIIVINQKLQFTTQRTSDPMSCA